MRRLYRVCYNVRSVHTVHTARSSLCSAHYWATCGVLQSPRRVRRMLLSVPHASGVSTEDSMRCTKLWALNNNLTWTFREKIPWRMLYLWTWVQAGTEDMQKGPPGKERKVHNTYVRHKWIRLKLRTKPKVLLRWETKCFSAPKIPPPPLLLSFFLSFFEPGLSGAPHTPLLTSVTNFLSEVVCMPLSIVAEPANAFLSCPSP